LSLLMNLSTYNLIYLIGFILLLGHMVFDFYSYQQQVRINISVESRRVEGGTVLTYMDRSGCTVFNNQHVSGADHMAFKSPCTNVNYYLKGPGGIVILILLVYGLMPILYRIISPLILVGGDQVDVHHRYKRLFLIFFILIAGTQLFFAVYSFWYILSAWGGSAASDSMSFIGTLILIGCVTAYSFFIRLNWGLHRYHIGKLVLLTVAVISPGIFFLVLPFFIGPLMTVLTFGRL
jgi:hypothetical protein